MFERSEELYLGMLGALLSFSGLLEPAKSLRLVSVSVSCTALGYRRFLSFGPTTGIGGTARGSSPMYVNESVESYEP